MQIVDANSVDCFKEKLSFYLCEISLITNICLTARVTYGGYLPFLLLPLVENFQL